MFVPLRTYDRPAARAEIKVHDRIWMRKAFNVLAVLSSATAVAWVSDYNWPTRTGNISIVLFLAANIYLPAKWLRKRFVFRNVNVYFAWLLRWHCLLNTSSFIVVAAHAYTASWANTWLWASLFLMGWLTIGGFLLRLKYPPRIRKGIYLLHTQQVAFVLLLYAMLKGHYVFLWLP
jgi:hypothetical protein